MVLALLLAQNSAKAQVTVRVGVPPGGVPNHMTDGPPSVSSDGRMIAFQNFASNLVPGTPPGYSRVYVFDRSTSTTSLVSVPTSGQPNTIQAQSPSISADGTIVCFTSSATNLIPGGTNGWNQVYCREIATGQTTLISANSSGVQGNQSSFATNCAVSADGRFVVFSSSADNLVANDTNFSPDVFVRDRLTMTTRCVSVPTGSSEVPRGGGGASISGDGSRVAFLSQSRNLDPSGPSSGFSVGVFVRDITLNETRFVSYSPQPPPQHLFPFVSSPAISLDGDSVAFLAGQSGVYVRNLQTNTTSRIDLNSAGVPSNVSVGNIASVSENGRFVSFDSEGNNLVPDDTNGKRDVFVRDRWARRTTRVSVATGGAEANGLSVWNTISTDGRAVAFTSDATNLVSPDSNVFTDAFAHERAVDARPGDANNDAVVDFVDLNIVLSNFGAIGAPGAQAGDVDDDGDCDFIDLNIVLGSFGMPV